MASYILTEDGFKILLEDGTGALLIEEEPFGGWNGSNGVDRARVYVDSFQMGARENPRKVVW